MSRSCRACGTRVKLVTSKSSEYRPIERQERKFNALRIPKSIEANLPYKSKPKVRSRVMGGLGAEGACLFLFLALAISGLVSDQPLCAAACLISLVPF